jgi:two-component system NtrC family response regulator
MSSRVLVVDPHADIAELLRRALERGDYEVETASSTASAIAQMERHEFSVALVNLRLPDGDGLRLLRLLKSRDPSPEVILMTGSCPSNATVAEATQQGAFHFLFKPFDLDEMLTVVANAERRRKRADSE